MSPVLRVTLPVDKVERLGDAYAVRIGDERPLYVHERHVVTVEDVPDPLPTEPGARFWGKTTDDLPAMRWSAEPAWWFVMLTDDGRLRYQRHDGSDPWGAVDAERWGLVRLPDPEVAP